MYAEGFGGCLLRLNMGTPERLVAANDVTVLYIKTANPRV